jgi:hypothetical protein
MILFFDSLISMVSIKKKKNRSDSLAQQMLKNESVDVGSIGDGFHPIF